MLWRKAPTKPARVILAEQENAMATLDAARADLEFAEKSELPIDQVRAAYDKVSAAYRTAMVTCVAARHLRGPAMQKQLRELITLEQEHLLNAPSGVLQVMDARPVSREALGPHIPGMEYDPTAPGNHARHVFGGLYAGADGVI